MRRTIITNIPIVHSIDSYYIDRTSTGSYQFLINSSDLVDKYNDKSKYLQDRRYFEMPETFEDGMNTITTNNGLVLIYKQTNNNTISGVIYDVFPSSFENKSILPNNIKLLNSQNTSSNFIIRNKQSYHSVVCKTDSVYLKPQCNIMTSDFHGTIDMDLPATFNCETEDNYCKHGLYKFTSSELGSFYIKAKPYLYISTGEPVMVTENLNFIKCSDNIYYIANITNQSYVEFKLTGTSDSGTSDCIVEFM